MNPAVLLVLLVVVAAVVVAMFRSVKLAQAVESRHLATYLAVVFFSSIYMGVVNVTQPSILEYVLKIPRLEQGRATSLLLTVNEIVMLSCIAAFGVLSDRLGRRIVYVLGFLVASLGVALFTHAPSLLVLAVFRAVYAAGIAAIAAMMVAVVSDYPADESRGKANGLQGFVAGAGAFLMFMVILPIPRWLSAGKTDPDMAQIAHQWFYIIAAIGVVAALMALGLKDVAVVRKSVERKPFLEMAREALSAARQDPGLALAYGAAFVSRGDLAVAGAYVVLWIQGYGSERGMSPDNIFKASSSIGMIAPLCATLSAPLVGIACDRFNRVGALAAMMALAAVAYNGMHFITDPTGTGMMVMMAIMGVAEIGAFVSSQALVSQQAPAHLRGSVSGFFGFSGAVGILVASLGGILIDLWHRPSAPFVLFGGANVVLFVWALLVRNRVVAPVQTASAHP